ncbi:hypothetical protein AAG570_006449 [Ranatra chinensis]|uniref:Uncharacterized protein n=1 Tax=Ranatra chinensis TaxID=642074 RepID=A0ABD0YUC9_9HEMI
MLLKETQQVITKCLNAWKEFEVTKNDVRDWVDEFKKKIDDETEQGEKKTPTDLERCHKLLEQVIAEKPHVEELSDCCETLMELCACNWVRDETVNWQTKYASLLSAVQELKHVNDELKVRRTELEHLSNEAVQLSSWSDNKNTSVLSEVHDVEKQLCKLEADCMAARDAVESEIQEYSSYHQSLQDTEKWLLQISFQLMAHNSLYITNREQTQEQIEQHSALLSEITGYQSNLDELKSKGHCQIERYFETTPQIKQIIEQQLCNVQDSYNSLLHTARQIKSRLDESLEKFLEYERTLESIMANLDEYEEVLRQNELEDVTSLTLGEAQQQLNSIRLQARMSSLGDIVSELEEKDRQLGELGKWVEDQWSAVVEWKNRPLKLRPEASRAEAAPMIESLNSLTEKRTQLLTQLPPGEHNDSVVSNIDSLQQLLMETLAKKQGDEALIERYRIICGDGQCWLDSITKRLEQAERGRGLTLPQKLSTLEAIALDHAEKRIPIIDSVRDLAEQVINVVSNLDSQQVEDQMKGLERRFNDMAKRVERKMEVIKTTQKEFGSISDEVRQARTWVRQKLDYLQNPPPIGYESKASEECIQFLKVSWFLWR